MAGGFFSSNQLEAKSQQPTAKATSHEAFDEAI
jgi:hypothetical protein